MRYRLFLFLLVVALGIAIGCRSGQQVTPELTDQSNLRLSDLSNDDQVREAIFRSAGLSRVGKATASYSYYLAVDDDQDPSDSLMEYLNDGGSFLKKVSRSYSSKSERGAILDKLTNKRGTRFSISRLTWLGTDKVKVSAGRYQGNMDAESCIYTLARENGEWKIISKEGCVVS